MSANKDEWKDLLDHLQCPYTVDRTDEEVAVFMVKPSEERLDTLEWLLLLYEPRLTDILQPVNQKVKTSKAERLLKAVNAVCLCQAKDVDLITGQAPVARQRSLINRLIELNICKASEQHISYEEASQYIDGIAEKGIVMKYNQIDRIPKDLRAEIDNLNHRNAKDSKAEMESSYPGLEEMQIRLKDCDQQIEKLQKEIVDLKQQVPAAGQNPLKEVRAMNDILSSAILDLDQFVSGFVNSYETRIGSWCQQSQPQLNGLGPVAKRVHAQLRKFMPLLDDTNKLRQLRCELENNIKENQTRKAVQASSPHSGQSDSIQKCLGILEESIHRIESGFQSRFPSTLSLL